jgi:hypothetical protein
MKHALLAAVAALAITGTAIANDSIAEMTAGGLVLKNSRNIDMLDEDLFVSAEEIRVNYVFRNQGRADESVIVAFPMPDRDLSNENESDVSHVRNFVTTVEGRQVQTQVERKALVNGRDVGPILARHNIPMVPRDDDDWNWERDGNPPPDPLIQAIERLTPADRAALKRDGLIDYEEGETGYIHPLWTIKETYYWTQNFPAGRELRITHRYQPGTGASAGMSLANAEFRRSADGRAEIREYCADRAFLSAIDRWVAQERYPQQRTVGYILRTGANWRSPIRNFRLVVDKGDPRNIVSFCGTNLRRISPTQFEMRRTNWRPDRDLRVLIAVPQEVVAID